MKNGTSLKQHTVDMDLRFKPFGLASIGDQNNLLNLAVRWQENLAGVCFACGL
jgi:hypothetical protein